MPELPEMETSKPLLNQKISGQTISEIQINWGKSINLTPELFIKTVDHQKIRTLNRQGKHLLF
ncbi:DNA-formamidopyrimidine glycosylase family protein [Neobacillus drentensis]|uniref:DNA-formamidopyrimidine glycosylase family protein n=1 Tax=Neobacillus drentensis TaxID=220684 RepID=UPI003B585C8D